ncbi:MAG: hypothetical protein U0744_14155 [Gemmataceae bacterium]
MSKLVQLLKKADDIAGDGTTTATILALSIYQEASVPSRRAIR